MQARTAKDYVAIIRAFFGVKSDTRLRIPSELLSDILEQFDEFAKTHKIRIELVESNKRRTEAFALGGALVGVGVGYAVANIPGALVGGVAGYCAGAYAAKMRLVIERRENGDTDLSIIHC